MFSAERILAIRKSKGFSQELLAEQSGVSLRTIQRVEQGETVPRGHTMQALDTALEVPLDALLATPVPLTEESVAPVVVPGAQSPAVLPVAPAAPVNAALPTDPQLLQLLNLSALCLLIFPFLNLLVP